MNDKAKIKARKNIKIKKYADAVNQAIHYGNESVLILIESIA